MIEGKTRPLEIASQILKPETISEIRQTEGCIHPHFLILDRWALNSPEMLKACEKKGGADFLLLRVDQQRNWEGNALDSDAGFQMSQQGMSDWEILALLGVDTELRTTELIHPTY